MAKQINNWNTAEGSLSVSLYKNPFTGSGYLGKVKRRNVALDILIGMIASKHPGVSEGLLQIAAGCRQVFLGLHKGLLRIACILTGGLQGCLCLHQGFPGIGHSFLGRVETPDAIPGIPHGLSHGHR